MIIIDDNSRRKFEVVNIPELLTGCVVKYDEQIDQDLTDLFDSEMGNYVKLNKFSPTVEIEGKHYLFYITESYQDYIRVEKVHASIKIYVPHKIYEFIFSNPDMVLLPDFRFNKDTCITLHDYYVIDSMPKGMDPKGVFNVVPNKVYKKLFEAPYIVGESLSALITAYKNKEYQLIESLNVGKSGIVMYYTHDRTCSYIYIEDQDLLNEILTDGS